MLIGLKPTPRQLEILQLIANGLTTREIAIKLGISNQTVKNHLYYLRQRMNAKSTYTAMTIAFRKGWIK